jgi:hypothetical protein
MTKTQRDIPQADPARPEPTTARPARPAYYEGGREADPTDRHMRVLQRLTDLCMEATEQLVARGRGQNDRRAAAPEAPPVDPAASAEPEEPPDTEAGDRAEEVLIQGQHPVPDSTGLALARLARAVRMSVWLEARLHSERLEREQKAATHDAAQQQRKSRLKQQLKRRVKEAIERQTEDEAEPLEREILERALAERLEQDDIERDILRYAPEEIVGRICRELGIDFDPALWTEDEWVWEEPDGTPRDSSSGGSGTSKAKPEYEPMEIEYVIVDPADPDSVPPSG